MSIDDRTLIETDKDSKEIAKLFLELISIAPEKFQAEEKEHGTEVHTEYWNAFVGNHLYHYPFSNKEYEEKLGIKPKISIMFTLNKKHIQEARIEILLSLLKLFETISCNAALCHNYTFPVLLYRDGKFILKSNEHFWQHHINLMANREIEYQDLPQF
jgi:hypothetical protein